MRVGQILGFLFLAMMAVTAARVAAQQSNSTSPAPAPVPADPLTKELQRCKALNEKAASDPACEAAYKEERRRFFSHGYTYKPAPVDMFPKEHTQSQTTNPQTKAPSTGK